MNTKKSLQSNLLLVLTALIWGVAFVAQHAGNEIGSFTFNAVRSLVGGIALLPVILFFDRRNFLRVKFGIIGVRNTILQLLLRKIG